MVNKRQDYSAYIISFYLCSFLEILESSSISYHIQYICVIIGYVIFIGVAEILITKYISISIGSCGGKDDKRN